MDTSKTDKIACQCSCHENKLKKLYEHDGKCCDKMNGYLAIEGIEAMKEKVRGLSADSSRVEEIIEEFEKKLEKSKNYPVTFKPRLQSWLTTALATVEREARAEAIREVMDCKPKLIEDEDEIFSSEEKELSIRIYGRAITQSMLLDMKIGHNQALNDWSDKIKNLK